MIELSDEVLCKYIDGELDSLTINQVEQALALDAGARVRLERMREADALLREAIPKPVMTTDDPWVQLIRTGMPVGGRATKHPFHRAVSHVATSRPIFFGSLAAGLSGVALGALFALSIKSNSVSDHTMATLSADTGNSLVSALDTINSGATLRRNDDNVRMILSFRARDGRHCRVFELSKPTSGAEGIACRDESQWQVVAWDATHTVTEGFRAAGASELIDGVMNRLGGDAALELSDEQELIDKRWHR